MNFQVFFKRSVAIFFGAMCVLTSIAAAQRPQATPGRVIVAASRPMAVAARNNLYCAGYVQSSPIDTSNKVVGAVEEQEQFLYAENDVLYVNMGSNKGVQPGDLMSVVRPRGKVGTRWTNKDDLGFYVQEVGALEVIRVKNEVSVVRVKTSCDNLLLGDLVQPMQQRTSPIYQAGMLDLYADPSGKATGRVFLARDSQEALSRDQIVYVDLGADNNVQVGDRLTVFRPLGKGALFISDEDESVSARDDGYQSFEYRGGKFSNQAARKSGDRARGRVVTTEKAKEDRPANLRKVVGEMVILNVKEKTATAVITKTAQEIHTGDWVEVQ
ncbi:MAG: hypothetical protein ABIU09_10060 [Pyrinomonadaceae bacterium]